MFAACGFSPPAQQAAGGDAAIVIDAPFIAPDASACLTTSVMCADPNTLRVCATVGGSAVDTNCSWGCSPNGAQPHCQLLQPTGSGAIPMDTVGSDVAPTTLGNTMIHLDTGAIDGVRGNGTNKIVAGIDFELRNGIAVFRFGGLHITGNVGFAGPNPMPPVVLVSTGSILIDGLIDATGPCTGGAPGPGGFQGGGGAGMGPGGGSDSNDPTLGGAGAGYGAAGGSGGAGAAATAIAGGSAYGSDAIAVLVGGSSGGGGNGGNPFGGAGGGSIQLVANSTITINNNGGASANTDGINAGGCGGVSGRSNAASDTGGGGGAGGAILLEAHDITINGSLAVNGGGGGGTHVANGSSGTDGQKGQLGRTPAAGGAGGDAVGGVGGAGSAGAGVQGGSGAGVGAGGGGAIGRIRFNTRTGTATVNASALLSPSLQDSPTTCTQGSAATTN